jgi:hypothetical protein
VEHGAHTLQLRFLDGLVDLDWLFVEKLDRDVQLQVSGGTFLSAVLGGGGEVVTTAASATSWERFTFDDSNGGALADGDVVYVQARNGLYLSVGADQKITASDRQPSAAAAFTIRVQGGGGLNPGAVIALEASDGIHYWTSGANDLLDATATSIGAAQTFEYGY